MHFCLGVYRLGYTQYLKPIADKLQYNNIQLDFQLKKWSSHDEFLLLVATAGVSWLHGM